MKHYRTLLATAALLLTTATYAYTAEITNVGSTTCQGSLIVTHNNTSEMNSFSLRPGDVFLLPIPGISMNFAEITVNGKTTSFHYPANSNAKATLYYQVNCNTGKAKQTKQKPQ